MKPSAFLTIIVTCACAVCCVVAGEDEPSVLATLRSSPLFRGPGPYYSLAAVLPPEFQIAVPRDVVTNPRAWLPVQGFPGRDAEFQKLVPPDSAEAKVGLWVAADNIKMPAAGEAPVEVVANVAELKEISATFGLRGFLDRVADVSQGKDLTRDDILFVLRAAFAPADVAAFREARAASKPTTQARVKGDKPGRLDVLTRLQMGVLVLVRLGGQMEGRIERDDALNQYVNLVGAYAAENSACYDRLSRVIVWKNDETVGAFSTPGGFIILTTGLLRQCKDESELAGLISHEMAHAYYEHGLKVPEYAGKAVGIPVVQLEMELDKEVQKNFNHVPEWHASQFEDLNNMSVDFLEKTLLKKYIIEDEQAADRFAAVATYNCGYDPLSLARLLERLGAAYPADKFLTNHGAVEDRVKCLKAVVEELGLANAQGSTREAEFRAQWDGYLARAEKAPGEQKGAGQ